jgi:lecithin-cholesterol acyltransferase
MVVPGIGKYIYILIKLHIFTQKKKKYFDIDLCFYDEFEQTYNNVTDMWENLAGVEIRAAGYPTWSGIVSMNVTGLGKTIRMYAQVLQNLTDYGYQDQVDLFAAPYDMRYDPVRLMRTPYLNSTVAVIEKAFSNTGGKKVWLTGHSYGCVVAHALLRVMPQSWKDRYVAGFISMSGPFQGTPLAPMMALTGLYTDKHSGGITMNPVRLSELAKRLGMGYWMLPFAQSALGRGMLVNVIGRNYSGADFPQLFQDFAGDWARESYLAAQRVHDIQAPNVTTYCINGYNLPTIHQIWFNTTKFQGQAPYRVTHTDGDSVVDRGSLNTCQGWLTQQPFPVVSKEIRNMVHGTGPFLPEVFKYWMQIMNPSTEKIN